MAFQIAPSFPPGAASFFRLHASYFRFNACFGYVYHTICELSTGHIDLNSFETSKSEVDMSNLSGPNFSNLNTIFMLLQMYTNDDKFVVYGSY